jgi:hypothetical protein
MHELIRNNEVGRVQGGRKNDDELSEDMKFLITK